MAVQSSSAAAGWLRDPTGRHQRRYWDGASWTVHVVDDGTTTTDSLDRRSLSWATLRWRQTADEKDAARWRGRLWWRRVLARWLDSLVTLPMLFVTFMAALFLEGAVEQPAPGEAEMGWFLLVPPVALWLYHAVSESSHARGTLGKRALGLRVSDLRGQRLTFWRASMRFWAGCLVVPATGGLAVWTPMFFKTNQTLYDLVSGCVVTWDSGQ